MTRRLAALPLAGVACLALAADGSLASFAAAAPGAELPAPWRPQSLPRSAMPALALVRDGDATVLEVRSTATGGGAIHALRADPAATPVLAWRWKVDRVLDGARMETRGGDDFAARVYVFFDVPMEDLPAGARWRARIARALYGTEVPTAALCYVWDNRQPVGTSLWNPYTDRVRMVVLRSGREHVGNWVEERRDVRRDFEEWFGGRGKPVPAITGVAVGNDTDQTGEAATARFADVRLLPR